MNKIAPILALAASVACATAQPVLRSGWTTSSVPATARSALGVLSATEVTNRFAAISGTILHSGLTVTGSVSATSFIGDGSGLTGVVGLGTSNLSDSGYSTVTRSNLQVGGVITSLTNASTLFLSVNGNNTTATRGHPDKPWLTWAALIPNIQNGDTVIVGPGTWTLTTSYNPDGSLTAVYGGVILTNKQNVRIVGSGDNTILYTTNWGNIMNLVNCTNVTIEKMKFQTSRPIMPLTPGGATIITAAICFQSNNFGHVIQDNTFLHIANQGVSGLYYAKDQRNITVQNNRFTAVGTTNGLFWGWPDGAAISGIGPGWVIRGNQLMHTQRGIELQPGGSNDGTAISNILVEANTIVSNMAHGIMIHGPYNNVQIIDNHIIDTISIYTNQEPRPIYVDTGTNVTIANNLIRGVHQYAVQDAGSDGIVVQNSRKVLIANNNISDVGNAVPASEGFGILVNAPAAGYAREVLIANNMVHGFSYRGRGICTGGTGQNVSDVNIVGNTVYDIHSTTEPSFAPIWINVGSNITVSGNTAFDPAWPRTSKLTRFGLYIDTYATNIYVGGNNFSGTKEGGVTNKGENVTFLADTNQWFW